MKASRKVFRDGKVHVCKRMCDTCIFRPGNLMDLPPGRVERMEKSSVKRDGHIPCHDTLSGQHAICRGFYDRNKSNVVGLRLAQAFKIVEFV